jgi:hypothetical protein
MAGPDDVHVVPTVRWACPRCGNKKPRTYAQHGRVRYHACPCGEKFRSLEMNPADLAERLNGGAKGPARLTAEQLRTLLPLAELARLLGAPEAAVAAVARDASNGRRGPLLEAGFPPPCGTHGGRSVWNRRDVLVHLSAPERKAAARRVALEQGLVGMAVLAVPPHKLPQIARARGGEEVV